MKTMRNRDTKTRLIYNHLLTNGSITSMEAFELFGATRLSAIIFVLRHEYHMRIENKDLVCIDRYGNICNYVRYIYVKQEEV